MRDHIPTLTHATERDVDLLLVEELACSSDLVTWVAGQAGWSGDLGNWRVLHSKRRTYSRREIDIQLTIGPAGGGLVELLIENKLDTTPQPDQAESYRAECQELRAAGTAFAASLLVCPQAYPASQPAFARLFDAIVTYEALRDRLAERAASLSLHPELAERLRFRVRLLDQAIGKQRRGYEAIPLPRIGDFNARYIELLRQFAPQIVPGKSMLKPANPAESVSMIFDHDESLRDLPNEVRPRRFAHELGRGQNHRANYVAVAFAGWGRNFEEHRTALARDLTGTPYTPTADRPTKVRPNPALRLITETPAVDNQGDFDAQRAQIERGIQAATELRRWLIDNVSVLRHWRGVLAGA